MWHPRQFRPGSCFAPDRTEFDQTRVRCDRPRLRDFRQRWPPLRTGQSPPPHNKTALQQPRRCITRLPGVEHASATDCVTAPQGRSRKTRLGDLPPNSSDALYRICRIMGDSCACRVDPVTTSLYIEVAAPNTRTDTVPQMKTPAGQFRAVSLHTLADVGVWSWASTWLVRR